jgi:hypothetical protein
MGSHACDRANGDRMIASKDQGKITGNNDSLDITSKFLTGTAYLAKVLEFVI